MPLLDIGATIALGLRYFTIIYLTGLGGLFSERSGIVNIGLEGMMIVGTVTGAWGAVEYGPVQGLLIGAAAGLLFSLVHAVATVTFKIDHIVSGVVINVVAIGIARFLSQIFFGQATQSDPGIPDLSTIDIPLLSSLPWGLGRAFENMSPVVPVAFLLTIPAIFVLNRTRFGLRLRSAGENPDAARTLGVRVAPLRYAGVAISGALAGFAGAFLAIEINGLFREGQTQGLGYIALAALILGNWNPTRLMLGSLLFGIAQAVPLRLNHAPVISLLPEEFIRMIPYVITIVAIAGFVGRVNPPAAAGKAYEGAGAT
ncbi:MAG: ral nucleoside transport system permease protein [Actinomycetota bacterium]|jgi:simple sugar transport system permease protein|nr:ral nucleoside transport system permease protein [Actinomycetota bacterium]